MGQDCLVLWHYPDVFIRPRSVPAQWAGWGESPWRTLPPAGWQPDLHSESQTPEWDSHSLIEITHTHRRWCSQTSWGTRLTVFACYWLMLVYWLTIHCPFLYWTTLYTEEVLLNKPVQNYLTMDFLCVKLILWPWHAAAAAAVCFLYVCFVSYSYAGRAPLQRPEWHDRTDSLHWSV